MTPQALKADVAEWARKLKVRPIEVHIRKMKHKWAICSSRGRLTFNADILGKPRKFIDEAIIHELLHLKYPNHGRMFKVMMKMYLGNS